MGEAGYILLGSPSYSTLRSTGEVLPVDKTDQNDQVLQGSKPATVESWIAALPLTQAGEVAVPVLESWP